MTFFAGEAVYLAAPRLFYAKGDAMAENYQLRLDAELAQITAASRVPRLLLHSCCAPCSSYVLEYLSRYFRITVLY